MAKYDSDRSGSDKAANRIKNYGGETMDGCDSTGRSRKYGANRTGKNVQLCVKIPLGIIK